MTDEEAFFVVVGVDEPAGDAVSSVAADFSGVRMKNIDAVDFNLYLPVFCIDNVDVGFTEDNEEIALSGIFEIVGHVQVGVHSGFENGDAAKFVELC